MANMNTESSIVDEPMDTNDKPSETAMIVGFETKEDILDEINYRFKLLNKFTIYIKNLPNSITRTTLKELFPEMVTCRFPEEGRGNKNYAFVQFSNETNVTKYLEILENKSFYGKKLKASKLDSPKIYTDLECFDLKKLYFNGLKPETRYGEIKSLYPNAKISLPTQSDKSSSGSVTLKFETEAEAMVAFTENKMSLHGIKCQLIFQMKHVDNSLVKEVPVKDETPEELLKTIVSRFETTSGRCVIVKNLPPTFSLEKLKQIVPTMRNCKINLDKKMGFIDFDTRELANECVKSLNNTDCEGRKIRVFVFQKSHNYTSLDQFQLDCIYLTNLPVTATEDDLKSVFPTPTIELHLNTDGTCIGTAAMKFETVAEARECFSSEKIEINGAPVFVNYFLIAEGTNAKKQAQPALVKETEVDKAQTVPVEEMKVDKAQTAPVEEKKVDEPQPEKSEVQKKKRNRKSIEKPATKNDTKMNQDKVKITHDLKVSLSPLVLNKEPEPVVTDNNKSKVTRTKSMIARPVKPEVKTQPKEIKKVVPKKAVVDKKPEAKPKEVKKVVPEKTVVNKKPEVDSKIKKPQPVKRRFDEVESEEVVDQSTKRSRVVAKRPAASKPVGDTGAKVSTRMTLRNK